MKTNDAIIRDNLHRFRYEDGKLYWVDGWRKGKEVGADNGKGHLRTVLDGKSVFVHRIIWAIHFESFPNEIDHINRVRSDNRIENLRAADSVVNSHNRSKPNTNTSGHVGVSWHKPRNKWQARIHLGNKPICLGNFHDLTRAVEAYEAAKAKYHVTAPANLRAELDKGK